MDSKDVIRELEYLLDFNFDQEGKPEAAIKEAITIIKRQMQSERVQHIDDYDYETDGDVLWWVLPVEEPPYCGTPEDKGFPEYCQHWSPLPANEVIKTWNAEYLLAYNTELRDKGLLKPRGV